MFFCSLYMDFLYNCYIFARKINIFMATYQYDEESVKAIVEWAMHTDFPKSLTLTEAEHIHDVARYVQASLYDIESHYPDAFYHPAITRLYRLKDALEGVSGD